MALQEVRNTQRLLDQERAEGTRLRRSMAAQAIQIAVLRMGARRHDSQAQPQPRSAALMKETVRLGNRNLILHAFKPTISPSLFKSGDE